MNLKSTLTRLSLAVCISLISIISFSQVPGLINRPSTSGVGKSVMDPNGDGYSSAATSGFGINDVANSELPFKGVRSYSIEPNSDLRRGPNHAYSDFVPDSAGYGFYYYMTAASQMIFRVRMGGIMPGSKGYSVLMDTDGKFGATGANADPNFQASTTGTNGNPGFEIEIVLETNFRIAIYNVDGTSSPTMVKQYTNWQDMSQVSIAATNDNGDPDFFIDFYIPFSDLQATPFNLTTSSPIRMTATTVMSPQAAIGGPRSDIYGVSGDTYDDFINGQPACNIFDVNASCSTAMCTAPPTVNSPLSTGNVNISGTWSKSILTGAASAATITVYKNGTSIGTISNVNSGNIWTLNNVTLVNGDIITAKAQATGESMCLLSNAVIASTCTSANRPAIPAIQCTTGSKGLGGSNLSTNWTAHVDNLTRNVLDNNVTNGNGLFGANSGSSPNITWVYSGGCSSGAPLTSGSYKIYYTDNTTGCASLPAYFCAAGNGGSALAGTLTAPTITSPSNSIFTTATKLISGTTDANAIAYLYIDGANVQTVTATGGNFSFSNLQLINGQQLYIAVEFNTGTVSTSKCEAQTAVFTVSCYTQPPVISADNNSQLTASSPIAGTSAEPSGSTIKVFTSANVLVATTTVQANGTWSTGNAGTTPAVYNAIAGTSYYANAQNGSCGVSVNTGNYASATSTSSVRCGAIAGPVIAGAAAISGTLSGSVAGTTVNLYLDGQLIGTSVTSNSSWGPIAVNTTANNTLYSNGVLSIAIQESGKQETNCPLSSITIACTPTPTAPSFSPSSTTIAQGQSVTYSISNAASGSFYAIADSASGASYGQGKWASSNGNLSITTDVFNTTGTYKVLIRSTSLSGVTQCSATSSVGIVNVNSVVVPLTLIDFKARKQAGNVFLEWRTANENNLNRFEIERSGNGFLFEKIGQREPSTGSGTKNYSFTEARPASGYVYYRLKMIDNDGKYSYSNIVAMAFEQGNSLILDAVMPNPFTSSFGIRMTVDKTHRLNVQLTDLTGRVVFLKETSVHQGSNTIVCDGLLYLGAGIYNLKIESDGIIWRQRILKSLSKQ